MLGEIEVWSIELSATFVRRSVACAVGPAEA